jgi:hypothetical protein
MRRLLFAATALIALAAPASAVTVGINDIGLSGTTAIQGSVEGNVVPGLTGTLYLEYDGATLNANGTYTWNFDYTVTNTSSGAITSRISSFALNTTPNPLAVTSTGLFDHIETNVQLPNIFGQGVTDFCASAGNNSCSGGDGLTNGQSASGEFNLNFAGSVSAITLDDAFLRFQSITGTAFGNSGLGLNTDVCVGCVPTPTAAVPELSTWFMMIIGFAGMGTLAYRRRNQFRLA